jgi:hypothetical protein
LTFTPTSAGAWSDSLTLLSNDPDEPAYGIDLVGVGVTAWSAYEVWGGNTDFSGRPEHWNYYYNIDQQDYVKLGEASGTATFTGTCDFYVIATRARVEVDTVEGSDGSYTGSGATGNTSDGQNIGGAPDGQCGLVGDRPTLGSFAGFIVISNPSAWTGLTVYVGGVSPSFSVSIGHDSRQSIPGVVMYEAYFEVNEPGRFVDSARLQTPTGTWYDLEWEEEDEDWSLDEEFDAYGSMADAFPDGPYRVEVHSALSGTVTTTFDFSGEQPNQFPVIISPAWGQSDAPTPLTAEWELCTDPKVTSIYVDIEDAAERELWDNWESGASTTSAGPMDLDPASNYCLDVKFQNGHDGTNADGYRYWFEKSTSAESVFRTVGGP